VVPIVGPDMYVSWFLGDEQATRIVKIITIKILMLKIVCILYSESIKKGAYSPFKKLILVLR
jgi:hypothetical protein